MGTLRTIRSSFGRAVVTGVVALTGALLGGCHDTISDKDIEFISLSEVRAATRQPPEKKAAHLIDPRSEDEFARGHIPGAENLQLPQVPEVKNSLDPRLDRYKMLIVYGNDPGSAVARAMTKRLMRSGAGHVKMFSGGLIDWEKAGYPVERAPR